MRRCSRTACAAEAVATLTFDYADSMAVLGPLSLTSEPHGYDFNGHWLALPDGNLCIDPVDASAVSSRLRELRVRESLSRRSS